MTNEIPVLRGRTYFIVHDASGRIKWTGGCDKSLLGNHPLTEGETLIDVGPTPVSQDAFFVSGGNWLAKAPCPVAGKAGGRVITLTDVPVGALVRVTGTATIEETAKESNVELSFGSAGTYQVKIDCHPSLDYSESFILE